MRAASVFVLGALTMQCASVPSVTLPPVTITQVPAPQAYDLVVDENAPVRRVCIEGVVPRLPAPSARGIDATEWRCVPLAEFRARLFPVGPE